MTLNWRIRNINNDWQKTPVAVILDSIRQAVQARADGRISDADLKLTKDVRNDLLRYAPVFSVTCEPSLRRSERRYTAESLAHFLGMVLNNGNSSERFQAGFGALELIELGLLRESDIKNDITIKHLHEMVRAIQKKHAEAEAARKREELEAKRIAEEAEKARVKAEEQRKIDLARAGAPTVRQFLEDSFG